MDKRVFCDCGQPLEYEVDVVVPHVRFKINKDGQVGKKEAVSALWQTNYGSKSRESYKSLQRMI